MTLDLTSSAPAAATSRAPSPAFGPEVFLARRERFLERIGGGVAVFAAAPELLRSRDTEVPYRQNSDFFYLTGFLEPQAVAVLTPHDPEHRLTLFVRPRDPEKETWSGRRAGVDGAREAYGADAAYPIAELDERLGDLVEAGDALWYSLGSGDEMDRRMAGLLTGYRRTRPRKGKGPANLLDPAAVLDRMRLVKEPGEIERMRAAAALSARAHLAAMRAVRPGMGEWELQALIENTFRAAGPDCGPAYGTIVGSGNGSTVLHYVSNAHRIGENDVVLIDAGAEIGFYCGDITRVLPASGRFTAPQRALYDVVHRALEIGISLVGPGQTVLGVHEATRRVLVEGMVELGLLSGDIDGLIESEAFKRFFMHQTSHWLGLDVHDAGPYTEPDGQSVRLAPGMVLTVEPGIYVAADAEEVPDELRGLGIRLEDNVLVTEAGREVLTRGVPVEAEEVERIVSSRAGA
ncbi:MAG TPA: aminopeptidase P N-terminal domain-containing protein, partial [Longimicrobium sp.]|nr:aminopeptidase P N-terminal domain-containing protein [Longimicrobium sp.]